MLRPILFGLASAALAGVAGAALAQAAAPKALVDAAKGRGIVGEQADGFLGFVTASSDAALQAAVREINAGRAEVYRQAAARAGDGATAAAAGGSAFQTAVFPRLPAGHYYRPAGGGWTRK